MQQSAAGQPKLVHKRTLTLPSILVPWAHLGRHNIILTLPAQLLHGHARLSTSPRYVKAQSRSSSVS